MPIHFAAARCASRSPVARALARKALRRAANDNQGGLDGSVPDARVLGAALRHFAAHGLRAAEEAATLADQARRDGEIEACQWWIEVCGKLDRKLGAELQRKLAAQDAG